MNDRRTLLENWLREAVGEDFRLAEIDNDASFRHYFRVMGAGAGDATWVAADMPPGREDVRTFVAVTRKLEQAGIRVPHVHAHDPEQGFALLDDLGDRTCLKALVQEQVDANSLYHLAIDELVKLQRADVAGLPDYDRGMLLDEMHIFIDWYCTTHLGAGLDAGQRTDCERSFAFLADTAVAQPQTFVHRDYHSRNLMLSGDRRIGVLDYQDAVRGPLAYDLVSLLRDCYIAWPQERQRRWIEYYMQRGAPGIEVGDFMRWYELAGIQRHLKAVGIFARLYHRDGKSTYLRDIPRTLAYITECIQRYSELDGLRRVIEGLPVR